MTALEERKIWIERVIAENQKENEKMRKALEYYNKKLKGD